jgi:hypothetical protein
MDLKKGRLKKLKRIHAVMQVVKLIWTLEKCPLLLLVVAGSHYNH